MKKSKAVPATLVASVAALILAGCSASPKQVRRCVDSQGNVLPDSECTTPSRRIGGIYPFWVYGGSVAGNRVSGYSRTPSSSADIVDSRGTVVRKGFGTRSSSSSYRGTFGS